MKTILLLYQWCKFVLTLNFIYSFPGFSLHGNGKIRIVFIFLNQILNCVRSMNYWRGEGKSDLKCSYFLLTGIIGICLEWVLLTTSLFTTLNGPNQLRDVITINCPNTYYYLLLLLWAQSNHVKISSTIELIRLPFFVLLLHCL